jgi:glycerol uptake operon antiterminator
MKKQPQSPFNRTWLSKPVIPVFWQLGPEQELLAHASLMFLQGGELAELPQMLERLKRGPTANIPVMLHIDLLAGLTSDEAGLRYLAELRHPASHNAANAAGIDGISTVRSHLVAAARRMGLASILLLFLQDGRSIERGLHIIEQSKPDMVELVPGVAALETSRQFESVNVPRIAGGLIRTVDLVHKLTSRGCAAVSTSDPKLWELNRPNPRA